MYPARLPGLLCTAWAILSTRWLLVFRAIVRLLFCDLPSLYRRRVAGSATTGLNFKFPQANNLTRRRTTEGNAPISRIVTVPRQSSERFIMLFAWQSLIPLYGRAVAGSATKSRVTTQPPSFRATERSGATEGSRGISLSRHSCHCKRRFLDSLRSLGMTYQGEPE